MITPAWTDFGYGIATNQNSTGLTWKCQLCDDYTMNESLLRAAVVALASFVMACAIGLSLSYTFSNTGYAVAATNIAVLALFIRQLAGERK